MPNCPLSARPAPQGAIYLPQLLPILLWRAVQGTNLIAGLDVVVATPGRLVNQSGPSTPLERRR